MEYDFRVTREMSLRRLSAVRACFCETFKRARNVINKDETTLRAHLVLQNGSVATALLQASQHVSYVVIHVPH